ncbi:hypothetical protein F5888DRAFT_1618006 [Russula emetica]|nr:hypothetical protein F5888DRAFT_1618006 [Russula emetica]
MSAENTSEPREHVQRMTDGWKEDAKGVLIFTGIFSAIVASFIIESYKMLPQDVGDQISPQPSHPPVSIITVNIMWLISLVLNIVSTLFATLTLQWSRRFAQVPCVPRAPRDRVLSHSFLFVGTLTYDLDRAVAMTVLLLHLSVFLFLIGLVIFFFTIHKIVATVVSVSVGLFGVVYLTLTVLACIDRSCPYRTPLSDVWRSHRGRQRRQGSTY